MLNIVLLLLAQDLKAFSDDGAGVRLKYPSSWESVRPQGPTTILHAVGPGDGFRPEIIVINAKMKNPTPVEEYKSQLKKMITESYKEAKFGEPKEITVFSRKGIQIEFEMKAPNGKVDLVIIKTGICLGLRRYLIVDGAFPKEQAEGARKLYLQLIDSIEFYPSKDPVQVEKGFSAFDILRRELAPKATKIDRREELDILLAEQGGDRSLGLYAFSFKNARIDNQDGYQVETEIRLEIDKGGKSLIKSSSFASMNLNYQKVDITVLNNGKVHAERTINGVKTTADFAVPEGTVFTDLIEFIQWRVQELPQADCFVRTLSVYDEHTEFVQLEGAATGRNKPEEAYTLMLTKPDGTVLNYVYSQDRAITRLRGRTVKGLAQPIWMKAKAK